ncbi:MAG: polyisoprenoid-binding protein YceI [Myxococcota bacterium]|jgi:polyisoprenoid-binding protein YceI
MHMKSRALNLNAVLTVFAAVALLAAQGCNKKSELEDKPTAKVEDPTLAPATKPTADKPTADKPTADKPTADKPAPAAKTLKLASTSTFGFVGAKVTGDHKGKVGQVEGTATVSGGKAVSLTVTAQMASLESDSGQLTEHLKSGDFFDVAKFPTAGFVSTTISEGGDGSATHTIVGNLTLHGVTKKLTFPATVSVTDAGASGKAEFKINRKDFGVVYPGMPDDLIKDEVLLQLSLNFAP